MSSPSTNPCITDGKCLSPTNLPEFIDTSSCLCGLLPSKQDVPNGGYIELWRCIGNATEDLRAGSNGKWYNTTLPSQELTGINMPQNWGENGPDTSQAFVVIEDKGGKDVYQKLGDEKNSPSLVGRDGECNGKNDTELSTQFYEHSSGGKGKVNGGAAMSASASSSSSAASASASSAAAASTSASSAAAGTATSASGTTPASTAGSSTSATASQSASGTSDAGHASVKVVFVFCMLLASLFASMA